MINDIDPSTLKVKGYSDNYFNNYINEFIIHINETLNLVFKGNNLNNLNIFYDGIIL